MLTVQPKVKGVQASNYLCSASAVCSNSLHHTHTPPLPQMTLFFLDVKQSHKFILQTTLNSLLPCPRATLNAGLTHPLVACPPPKVKGRQFPWKPPVEVFFSPSPELRALSCLYFLLLKCSKKERECLCVLCSHMNLYLQCVCVCVSCNKWLNSVSE